MSLYFNPPSYNQAVFDMDAAAATSNNVTWPTHYSSQQQNLHQYQQVDGNALLRLEREREGRCLNCGAETHKLIYKTAEMLTLVYKEPLTVDKEVYQGQCLLCYPVMGDNGSVVFQTYQASDIPQQHRQQIHFISNEEEGAVQLDGSDIEDEEVENNDEEILEILCRMRSHPHDLPIHISSFHALWVLSWETENAIAIGRLGGIPIILESLHYHLVSHLNINNRYNRDHHTNSPSVVRQMQLQSNVLATIQNLSSVNGYNKELLVGSSSEQHGGGISLLLLSMSTFLQNAEIQRSGCFALANILSSDSEGNCYKFNILNSGGLDVIANSIKMHKDHEGVARAVYKCLCLLGQNPSWEELVPQMETEVEDVTNDEGSVNGLVSDTDGDAAMFDNAGCA